MERSTRSGKIYKRKSTLLIEPSAKRARMDVPDTENIHTKVIFFNSFFCLLLLFIVLSDRN